MYRMLLEDIITSSEHRRGSVPHSSGCTCCAPLSRGIALTRAVPDRHNAVCVPLLAAWSFVGL